MRTPMRTLQEAMRLHEPAREPSLQAPLWKVSLISKRREGMRGICWRMAALVSSTSLFLLPAPALATEQPISDDTWSIGSHGFQTQSFELRKEAKVLVDLHGVQHAEKGFLVHILK